MARQPFSRFRPASAWQPWYPVGANRWDTRKVAHLYRRAACGADWQTIQDAAERPPGEVIAGLLEPADTAGRFDDDVNFLLEGALASDEPQQLQAVWLYRMLHSPDPLRERMTLFWHNHFATSNAKVGDLRLMQDQNELLRRHALGHFGELLQSITRDPAMIVWLDGQSNRKGQPNENYAREIFELFSLGVGNYTERDIAEAARAFTGWEVRKGVAMFHPERHDDGEKTILGATGPWTAGDVVRIALSQPACSRFIVRKIVREFLSEAVELPDDLLAPLADGFRQRNYDITWLLHTIFASWIFNSEDALRQRVAAPVEWMVSLLRGLEGNASPQELAEMSQRLGQTLFYPPSVKGWDGGSNWLDSTRFLHRQNLTFELTSGDGLGGRTDPARLAKRYKASGDEELVRLFLQLFLQDADHAQAGDLTELVRQERKRMDKAFLSPPAIDGMLARTAAHLVLSLPECQLM